MRAVSPRPGVSLWGRYWAGALGGFLGLALLKFGNPVILDRKIVAPKEGIEFILLAWPVAWGYGLLAVVALLSIPIWRWRNHAPKWALALPLVWLAWQGLSAIGSVDFPLSKLTLLHFASCAVCFYLGLFALAQVDQMGWFWTGLAAGFVAVVAVGWEQHFGGLEETRRFFYELPNWRDYPPEFLKKISSNRIYATLFYPNTLAGVLILLLPMVMAVIWETADRGSAWLRAVLVGVVGVAALGCLYWSGSKAGWLIMLAMGLAIFLRLPVRRSFRMAAVALVLAGGLAGFFARYAGYFERGATSVSARFDYWRAAGQLTKEHPLLGSGPGTFSIGYKRLKPPEAEMARLAHNDYLEQAADSGIPGAALYFALIVGSLAALYPRPAGNRWLPFCCWLGVAGLAAQSVVEFPIYIPALAWPMFLFLGWLWGSVVVANPSSQPEA